MYDLQEHFDKIIQKSKRHKDSQNFEKLQSIFDEDAINQNALLKLFINKE